MTVILKDLVESIKSRQQAHYLVFRLKEVPSAAPIGKTINVYLIDNEDEPLVSHTGSSIVDVITYLKYWMDWHVDDYEVKMY